VRLGPRPSPYEAFKTLRNRLRKLRYRELIQHCLGALNHPKAGEVAHLVIYPTWEILLLLKWIFVHGEPRDALTKPLRENEFGNVVNLTKEVFNCAMLPSAHEDILLFMRKMAYQQFWLQTGLHGGGLARQSLIFGGLPDGHRFRRLFRNSWGIDIPDFVELSVMLIPKLLEETSLILNSHWFSPVANQMADGAVEKFLSALSTDLLSAKQLAGQQRYRDMDLELYERTPFLARPLLRLGTEYVPMSKVLLTRTLEMFVYRFLRDYDAEEFMQAFGPIFERYIHRLLTYAGTPYLDEEALKKACPGQKVVDAFIREGADNVYVEAKGIEFPELGMITHLPEVVRGRAKPSILRGIDQAYSTLAGLASRQGAPSLGSGANYLIVVTMMDTFVGNGSDFFSMVGMEELTKIQDRHGVGSAIPPDAMYFMSVPDLEVLCKLVKDGKNHFCRHTLEGETR